MNIKQQALEIIKKGSTIAGAVVSTVLALQTKDPDLQILISAGGAALPETINDFAERTLSEREKIKIGAIEALTIDKIVQHQANGATINPRFLEEVFDRPKISELYEGVLINAKNTYEEKKLLLLSNYFGNCIFNHTIAPINANYLLNIFEQLPYYKICILSFYGRLNEFQQIELLQKGYIAYENIVNDPSIVDADTSMTLQSIFELRNIGLLDAGEDNRWSFDERLQIIPNIMKLSTLGKSLFELFELNEIEIEELTPIGNSLQYKPEYGRLFSGR